MDNGEDIGKTDRYLTVQIDIQEYNEEERGRTRVLGVQVAHLNYMGQAWIREWEQNVQQCTECTECTVNANGVYDSVWNVRHGYDSVRSGNKSCRCSTTKNQTKYLKPTPTPLHNYYNDQCCAPSFAGLKMAKFLLFAHPSKKVMLHPFASFPIAHHSHPFPSPSHLILSLPFHLVPESHSLLIHLFATHSHPITSQDSFAHIHTCCG